MSNCKVDDERTGGMPQSKGLYCLPVTGLKILAEFNWTKEAG